MGCGTAAAATTQFVWQGNNLVQAIDPDENTTTYGCDDAGHAISITDALGNTTTMTYNAQGLMTSETNADGMPRPDVQRTGPGNGRDVVRRRRRYRREPVDLRLRREWQADRAGNDEGTYTFRYDSQGRVIEVDGPFGMNLTYAYDANGNRVLVQDSAGGSMASSYNDAGQLVDRWFSEDGQPLLGLAQGYNSNGQLVAQTDYAGDGSVAATTAYSYDAAGNLVLLTHTAADGTVIAAYAYSYDTGGNLVAENDTGSQQSYGYDGAGELTDDNGSQQTFDANGNRTNPGYVTGLDNQLLSDGTWNYTYDKEGNLAGKTNIATGETWTYGYDNLNEMTSAVHRDASGAPLLECGTATTCSATELRRTSTTRRACRAA